MEPTLWRPHQDDLAGGGWLRQILTGFTVVCADGRFKVSRVQPDGAKKIDASEWTKSAKVAVGAKLG